MDDPASIAEQLRKLQKLFRDAHPSGTEDWIFIPIQLARPIRESLEEASARFTRGSS